jgi:protein-S-isoprenylcysteine O-methyltransferase Ste14
MNRLIAWLGAAAFVLSLAVTAWWYFLDPQSAEPFAGPAAIAWDAALVSIFALHHSLFARDRVKRALSVVPEAMKRSLYVWIASLLLIAVVGLWQPVGGQLYAARGAVAALLACIQAAGFGLIARSAAGLDPLELAGVRQAGGAPTRYDRLQIGGPYRFVRHPLYLGWILAFGGAAHMTGDRLTFAVLTTAYLLVAIRWEERALMRTFGDEYARYRMRVRWRVVPGVY